MPRRNRNRANAERLSGINSTSSLDFQLFLHEGGRLRAQTEPVRNNSQRIGKPNGGFWTSTYHPDYGSEWVQWCVAHRWSEPFEFRWAVLSAPKSRIAVVDSRSDLAALIDAYPRLLHRRRGIDFERLATEWDALHLTHQGYLQTRWTRSDPALLGWDCESTVWFRWVFERWRNVKPRFKHVEKWDDLWLKLTGWTNKGYRCRLLPGNVASRKVYDAMLREHATCR